MPRLRSACCSVASCSRLRPNRRPNSTRARPIQLLVGFGPGGEDDVWARTIAKHIGNHIPGNPAMVRCTRRAPAGCWWPTGSTTPRRRTARVVGMINRGIPFEPLLGGQGTQFDALKFNYVGSPGRDTTVCAARKDAPGAERAGPLQQGARRVGGTGSGADTAIYPQFLAALLGMKFKLVQGYKGSGEIQLAMERKEVDRASASPTTRCCAATSRARARSTSCCRRRSSPIRGIKDVPLGLAGSAHSRRSGRRWSCSSRASTWAGRSCCRPGCRPTASRRSAHGFQAMLKDTAFLDGRRQAAAAASWRLPASRWPRSIANAYKTPPAIVQRTMKALGRGGYDRHELTPSICSEHRCANSLTEDFSLMPVTEASL